MEIFNKLVESTLNENKGLKFNPDIHWEDFYKSQTLLTSIKIELLMMTDEDLEKIFTENYYRTDIDRYLKFEISKTVRTILSQRK